MRVLLVEDEAPKRDHILDFLRRLNPALEVEVARGVRSAIKAIISNSPDLLLLDMSLPTFDQGPDEPGGRPQGFGGIEVMRYMDRYETAVPVIVVTAYEAFAHGGQRVDLQSLNDRLAEEHPDSFKGLVYFNPLFGEWDLALREMILNLFPTLEGAGP